MSKLVAENLSLVYPMMQNNRSLKQTVLRAARGDFWSKEKNNKLDDVVALKDISLSLKAGDRIGLVGGNGAGKSTLLKTLSGIYEPSTGSVIVEGTMQSMLALGALFDPEESGWENVEFYCAFKGITGNEIKRVREDVDEFTELGKFLDYPVRSYSSGMQARLAFALATTLSPQILLVDEVVGAGDARFFKKAEARMNALAKQTEILVVASHSNELISSWCNKALWLERGCIRAEGAVDKVLQEYSATV